VNKQESLIAIIAAYVTLIAIWSTTPIAIKWSAMDVSFAGGIFWRILISACLALLILKMMRERLFFRPGIWRFYAVGALGIAPNFLLVYWASLWIPSGLISVIFSAVPFLMGVLSYYWLGKNVFTRQRVIALLIALSGILVIFYDQLEVVGEMGAYGIVAMVLSVLVFAVSSTWLQKMAGHASALQTTTGSLCFSVPLLALVWWLTDGSIPIDISFKGVSSILYLGIVGSLIGFFLFYFLLHRLSAYFVSTVGMISPVFALMISAWIADENIGNRLVGGAVLVLSGLALYHMRSLDNKVK
jgi:drug/metabolite transporter (DMT)-like permease